ncbi:MAG: hypothetical protein ACI4JA_06500, partial [Oscillospiraceae bacterium]
AGETMPMIIVQDQNWSAVIDLLERLCECQEEMLKMQSELMTEEEMKKYLENQKVICEQSETACRAIQKQTAEQSAQTLTSLISQCESLKLQAGKMSEEYSFKLKSLEEWKSKQGLKLLKAVVISQSVLLILSAALQLWLR